MNKGIFVYICLFISTNVFPQKQIKGCVVDKSGGGIDCATLCLRTFKDSAYVCSTLTDATGTFHLKALKGRYILQVEHLAYADYAQVLWLDADTLLRIPLQETCYQMSDFEVIGHQKAITSRNGNLQIDVAKLRLEGESVQHLLKRLPGVESTSHRGVTLNGRSVTVYINGNQQMMSGEQLRQYLASLPAAMLKRVELIAIPDGAYDASTQAVIKIYTLEEEMKGHTGQLGAQADFLAGGKKAGEGLFTYAFNHKRVSGSFYVSLDQDYTQEVIHDSTVYSAGKYIQRKEHAATRTNAFRTSDYINIQLPQEHLLRLNLFVYDDFSRKKKAWCVKDAFIAQEAHRSKVADGNDDLWSFNLQYENADTLCRHYEVSYGFVYGGVRSDEEFHQLGQDADLALFSRLRMVGRQHILKSHFDFRLDKRWKVYAGTKMTYGVLTDRADYNQKGQAVSASDFRGKEGVAALYAGVYLNWNAHLSLRASLRLAYTDFDLNLKSSALHQRSHYCHLLPYAALNYTTTNYNGSLGFFSRVIRPNYNHLLPGVRYENAYLYTKGNPNLKPSRYYAVNMYNTFFEGLYLNLAYSYGQHLSGVVYKNQPQGKIEKTYLNYRDRHSFSTTLSFPFCFYGRRLSGKLSTHLSSVRYTHFKNGFERPAGRRLSYTNGDLALYMQYETQRFAFGVYGNYAFPYRDLSFSSRQSGYVDVYTSYVLGKRKQWLLKFSVDDVFNSLHLKRDYYINRVRKMEDVKRNTRYFSLSFVYRFRGGMNIEKQLKGAVDNDTSRFKR